MTIPAPTFATAARTAEEEDAEIAAWIDTHAEDVSRLRRKLADMPVNDTQRKHVRTRLAEAVAAIEDAKEARAALAPRLDAERAEGAYRRQYAQHAAALADIDGTLLAQAGRVDDAMAFLVSAIATLTRNAERAAARAGIAPMPWHLHQPVPNAGRFIDVLLGKLCVAGLLDADSGYMPSRYMDGGPHVPELGLHGIGSPVALATADSATRALREMRDAIAATPPRSPDDLAREAAARDARRAAEAAMLAQPVTRLPAPPPTEHRAR